MMELNTLTAISPVDGRYRKQVAHLDEYFSEYALIKYRVKIEVAYFIFLADKKFFKLSSKGKQNLTAIADNFSLNDAEQIKQIETITNHDVKAVEYLPEAGAG
jgi:adenylosuccinate lyase